MITTNNKIPYFGFDRKSTIRFVFQRNVKRSGTHGISTNAPTSTLPMVFEAPINEIIKAASSLGIPF